MNNRKRKCKWNILLLIGIIPLIIPIMGGIYDAITGFSGLCFFDCNYYYGFKAFINSVYLYSFIFWPTYIISIILMIFSVIKLKNK